MIRSVLPIAVIAVVLCGALLGRLPGIGVQGRQEGSGHQAFGADQTGGSVGTPGAMAVHPLVGTWIIDVSTDPGNAPGIVVFMGDGTLVELHPNVAGQPDGAGVWRSAGEREAAATIVFHNTDESERFGGTTTVLMMIEVDDTGQRFTAPYVLQVTASDGSVVPATEDTATATRIQLEPMVRPGTTTVSTPTAGTPAPS